MIDPAKALRTEHRGWHTPRGLPHFDSAETTQAITFRLADALPKSVVAARKGGGTAAYRRRIEATLDASAGACWLRKSEAARIIVAVLLQDADVAYDLHAFVVMPNHVHALVTQRDGHRLAEVVQAWKSVSAKAINNVLGRTGRLWQRDYYDRFMRDEAHFERARAYIERNPVTAGLVVAPEDWPFSSCSKRSARSASDGDEASPLRSAHAPCATAAERRLIEGQ